MYVDTLLTLPAAYILTLIVGLAHYSMPANWCQQTTNKYDDWISLKISKYILAYVSDRVHKPFLHIEDLVHLH